jgi:hypothetical protein
MALPTGSLSIAKAVQRAADVRCYLERKGEEKKRKALKIFWVEDGETGVR